jgi:hypothetical protein
MVTFDPNPPRLYEYEAKEDKNINVDIRNAMDRRRTELACLQQHPERYLKDAVSLFETCRLERDVVIVFGNLGKYPSILTYFLDICFTADESVGVLYDRDVDCPYRVRNPIPTPLDVLIVVDPDSGYDELPAGVDHLIVLTSHVIGGGSRFIRFFIGE